MKSFATPKKAVQKCLARFKEVGQTEKISKLIRILYYKLFYSFSLLRIFTTHILHKNVLIHISQPFNSQSFLVLKTYLIGLLINLDYIINLFVYFSTLFKLYITFS